MNANRDIGDRVRKARKACGLTQSDLASVLDCGRSNIAHIEAGNAALSGVDTAKLAVVLRVTTDHLLTGRSSPAVVAPEGESRVA